MRGCDYIGVEIVDEYPVSAKIAHTENELSRKYGQFETPYLQYGP